MSRMFLYAMAATAALTAPGFAQALSGDNEIIVTAQRREQAAQDVAVALSVVTGQALVEAGVVTVNGLENLTPSLEVESQFGGGQPSFSLRGVGFRDYATNNAPTVGVYVDEVAYPVPVMTQGVLFDVARVEVLRGPQGTLYGRNTTGGAISIVSNRPSEVFEVGATAEISNFARLDAEGYVSGPLGSGGMAARLSAAMSQGGAWQENRETGAELGDTDIFAGRLQVLLPVGDRVEFLLNVNGFQDESDGLGLQLFKDVPALGAVAHSGQRQTSWGSSPLFAEAFGGDVDTAPFRENTGFGASLITEVDLGFADLIYIAAFQNLDRKEFNDWDAVPEGVAGVYFQSDVEVQSHEVRLTSPGDERIDWIAGVYYSTEELDELYQSDFGASFGPDFQLVSTPYDQEVETFGVFGQVDVALTPQWNVVAGVRYEEEERDLIGLGTFANGFGTFNFANGTVDGTLENRSTSLSEVTGRLALEYRPADNLLFFGSVSRGVKSGGFTGYNTLNPRAVDPFEPEILIAYEAGFKSDLFEDTVRLNGAVFYYDYTDQQVQNGIFDPALAAAVGRISNAPESHIVGGELELTWQITPNFTTAHAVGYQKGEYDEFRIIDINASTLAGVEVSRDASGDRLGPPEVTYRGSIAYEDTFMGDIAWRGLLDWSYRGDTDPPLLQPVSGEGYEVPSYWLLNATLAFTPQGGPVEIAFWGRNILDEDYEETRNFFAGPDFTPLSAPGMPATYGVRVSYRQ